MNFIFMKYPVLSRYPVNRFFCWVKWIPVYQSI